MSEPDSIHLKVPLLKIMIGNGSNNFDFLKSDQNCINFDKSGDKKNEFDKNQMKLIENAFGRYIKYTDSNSEKKINSLVKLFFPGKSEFKDQVNDYLKEGEFKEEGGIPLFILPLQNKEPDRTNSPNFYQTAAWANLLFELGLFNFEDKKEYNYHNLLKYYYETNNKDIFTFYANVKDSTEEPILLEKIYKNIISENIQLVFIDDSRTFGKYHGIISNKISDEKENKVDVYSNENIKNVFWLYPGRPFIIDGKNNKPDYNELFNKLDKKIDNNAELYVFSVDFIYKKIKSSSGSKYNTILGDNLIKEIKERYDDKNILIIGYTGGESPFIINSANKVGADIVIFKERGSGSQHTGHAPTGNSAGMFDLLWAISWNVSVWKALKIGAEYDKDQKLFELIQSFFPDFPDLVNASPFWRNYLKKFSRKRAQKRFEEIFDNKKNEK